MADPARKPRIIVVAFERLNNTPAVILATKGWLENVDEGTCEPVANVAWDQKAFVAYAGPSGPGVTLQPVGVITWTHEEWRNQVFVNQSYVDPAWRGRGIYQAMWDELVAKARTIPGVRKVASITHAGNERMRRIAAKQGRAEEAVTLTLYLPDAAEAQAQRPAN